MVVAASLRVFQIHACVLAVVAGLFALHACGEVPENIPTGHSTDKASAEALAYLRKAKDAYREERFRLSLALTDTARSIDPDLADVPFLRGLVFTRIQQYARADSAYEDVAQLMPSYPGLWFNRGNLAFRLRQYERALELYDRENTSDVQSRLWTNTGRAYAELRKFDSAKYAYQIAIQADSTNTSAYGWLSRLYQQEGKTDTALTYSRRALDRLPSHYQYRYLVGSQLVSKGRHAEAIPYLDSVVTADASHRGARYNLGKALLATGEIELGKRHLQAADSLRDLRAILDRKRTYAIDNPNQTKAWLTLAEALRKRNRFHEALQSYQAAQTLRPNSAAISNDIANLYLEIGDTSKALQEYHDILRRNPSQSDVWFNLGVLYANMGRKEDALHSWRRTLSETPNHPMAIKYIRMLQQD